MPPNNGTQLSVFVHVFLALKYFPKKPHATMQRKSSAVNDGDDELQPC